MDGNDKMRNVATRKTLNSEALRFRSLVVVCPPDVIVILEVGMVTRLILAKAVFSKHSVQG